MLLTLGKLTWYICKSYQTIKLNTRINIEIKTFYGRKIVFWSNTECLWLHETYIISTKNIMENCMTNIPPNLSLIHAWCQILNGTFVIQTRIVFYKYKISLQHCDHNTRFKRFKNIFWCETIIFISWHFPILYTFTYQTPSHLWPV